MSPTGLVLAGAQLAHQAVLERFRKADDGVERRAQLVRHGRHELGLHPAGVLELDVLFLQRLVDALAVGDVAGSSEHALQLAVAVVEGGGVVGDHRLLAVERAHRQLVVADLVLGQHALIAASARIGSVKKFLQGAPISSSRERPVSATICWLTSVMMPCGLVVISASMFDSISERV
jgi:hypothetical protein